MFASVSGGGGSMGVGGHAARGPNVERVLDFGCWTGAACDGGPTTPTAPTQSPGLGLG